MITKLEGLASIMNQANQIVSDAVSQITASYGNAVESIPNLNISTIQM